MRNPSRRELIKTTALTAVATAAGVFVGRDPEPDTASGLRLAAPPYAQGREAFDREAARIYERHWRQTKETVAELKRKYDRPIFGRVAIWDVVQKLAFCVDRTDRTLYCATQLTHVEQILTGMEEDGIVDEDMILAALTHDLGKVLLTVGEADENVVCANRPIGDYATGVGLDHVIFQWNHDEFIYSRLKDYVPDHVAWLLRYHSIKLEESRRFMDARDLDYTERYLLPFRRYDFGTKSACFMPRPGAMDAYRSVIERVMPAPILI
jgi:predicted HD phosphohydrolase